MKPLMMTHQIMIMFPHKDRYANYSTLICVHVRSYTDVLRVLNLEIKYIRVAVVYNFRNFIVLYIREF